jgi:hypothetical protein
MVMLLSVMSMLALKWLLLFYGDVLSIDVVVAGDADVGVDVVAIVVR